MNRRGVVLGGLGGILFSSAASSQNLKTYEIEARSGYQNAYLFVPKTTAPAGAVVFFHGSEGGANGSYIWLASWLASFGFVTMPLPYSAGGNTWHAGDIVRVSIDRTFEAIEWLRKQLVCNGKVGLCGYSRGAEHALLVASLIARDFPDRQPKAVAAHASTDVAVRDFFSAGVLPKDPSPRPPPQSSWTWRGSEIAPGTPIEIERFNGGIYLSHGELDDVWSVQKTRNLEKRLLDAGRQPTVRYHADQKHSLSPTKRTEQVREWAQFFHQYLS